MKRALLIIGHHIKLNPSYCEYVIREVTRSLENLDILVHLSEQNKDLFLEIETYLEGMSECVVAVDKKHFTTVSKLLATMLDDTLVLKEDILIPSKADVYEKGSFLIHHNGSKINVIEIQIGKRLPEILIQEESHHALINVFRMDEESIALLLSPLAESHNVRLEVIPFIKGWGVIQATSQKFGGLSQFIQSARQLFTNKIIASQNVIAYIIERFFEKEKTISFAESCTGGYLASLFTKESGSSKIFNGSVISYANIIKQTWLEVDEQNLLTYGAVSEAVVKDMLNGILNLSGADYGIAISGIAGPTGGVGGKPVGTVFIGVKCKDGREIIERVQFDGDRQYIQQQAAWHGILLLIHLAESELF